MYNRNDKHEVEGNRRWILEYVVFCSTDHLLAILKYHAIDECLLI